MSRPPPGWPLSARKVRTMRKSASVLMPSSARSVTLPPLPPSPPSGPPKGTNFSRRKLTQPRPPLPAWTRIFASSTNFMEMPWPVASNKKPGEEPGFSTLRTAVPVLVQFSLLGVDAHEGVAFGALLRELDLAFLSANSVWSVPMPTLAPARMVVPRWRTRMLPASTALAAELLHAEALAVRFAAVTSTAACLFMCHVSRGSN